MNMLCFSSRFIHTRFSNHCVKVCARLCYETICRDLCFYLFGTFLCFVFVLFVCLKRGHSTTVFCQISVRRSKNCLYFSIV